MLTRRRFFTVAGAGLGALGAGSIGALVNPGSAVDAAASRAEPDAAFVMTAAPELVPVLKGPPTPMWTYRATQTRGRPSQLEPIPGSYLGPTLRVARGQRVRITYENRIPAESIIHWHGLHVPAEMDGHPRYSVPEGGRYTYEFDVVDRAGTYWYHPHPHGRTGHQVYSGLAGLLVVTDAPEAALDLPSGPTDVPIVIQDRTFDRDNRLIYLAGGMMDRMTGVLGDVILVNGRPDYTLEVATRMYRLRMLNGSNARAYKLAWDDGTPITVIGTDGGLLPKPVVRSFVMIGPGERLDVWADFTRDPVGTRRRLVSRSFGTGGSPMGMGMMGHRRAPANGAPVPIMGISVVRRETEHRRLPAQLSEPVRVPADTIVNPEQPRRFVLQMAHMRGLINGRRFQMTHVADDEIVRAGTVEMWEFDNTDRHMGMMGMELPHPMHLHGAHLQVLARSGAFQNGYVDEGWKDTVLLMPGERVRLLVRFGTHTGMFLYHCHNLEHGDAGMMRNYMIL